MISYGQGRLDFDPDLLDELDAPTAQPITEHTAKASIDALLASAGRYGSPDEYRDLIQFVGRLPTYSPFNRMLVHLQDPGAEYVATAARWRAEYGRATTPGAPPIIVMRPRGPVLVVYDVRHTEPVVKNARPVPRSATDPLAIGLSSPDVQIKHRWELAEHNAIRDGIRIQLADRGGHSGGFTTLHAGRDIHLRRPKTAGTAKDAPQFEEFPLRYDIVVNQSLSLNDRYATLVHELAHVYCGHLGSPDVRLWPSRRGLPLDVTEVEAESVVHMLLSRIDADVQMGDYIHGHLSESGCVPAGVSLNAMMKAAGLIEDMGASRLPKRKPRHSQ